MITSLKTRRIVVAVVLTSILSVPATRGAEAVMAVNVKSAQVFRGETFTGNIVAQPWAQVTAEELPGIMVGTWANFVLRDDDDRGKRAGKFTEVDLYASYTVPVPGEAVGLSLGLHEYTYPGVDLDSDREVNAVISLKEVPLTPTLGLHYGIDGDIMDGQFFVEGKVQHDVTITDDVSVILGGALGYLERADFDTREDGFSYGAIEAGVGYGAVKASVTWFIETDEDVMVVDEEVLWALGVMGTF